jgi:hypothetical protein
MALTITIEGKGIIANCDLLADTAGGDWKELGGGSIGDEADAFLYGTTSIGMQYASKSGWTYQDLDAVLDFDTAGTEEGQFIYIWLNIAAPAAFDTLANKGFAIRLGTTTLDYREWIIAGEDDSNGWSGGWKLFVLDPTKTGSVTDTGTYDVGSIDLVGIWIDTNVSVRADSIFIDQIAVGNGLRITGTWDSATYSGAWEEAVAYCTDFANRAWGMLQERDGIYYAFGKIYIGDTGQAADTLFEDSGKIIQFGTSQYYISAAWASTMPTDACGIVIEDHASWKTTFTDGVIVGTEQGRSGSVIVGNADQQLSFDMYGGNNAASLTNLYGTTLKKFTGTIEAGDDTDHKFLSVSLIESSQFNPGTANFKNSLVLATSDADGGLLIDDSGTDNISDLSFISDGSGHGIYIDTTGTYTFDNIVFSGYGATASADAAIYNNSGGEVIINATNGSTGLTYKNGVGATTTVNNAVTLTVTVKDEANVVIVGASVSIYKDSDDTELINEVTNASGIATESFNFVSDTDIYVRVRKSSSGTTRYFPVATTGKITSAGFSLTVVLKEDSIAN